MNRIDLQQLALVLIKNTPPVERTFWPWLGEVAPLPVDMKRANKWFLGGVLDYQVKAERAWESARKLAEDIYNDPPDLWQTICVNTEEQWMAKFAAYSLHRFPAAHRRVWRIGKEIVGTYGGDARQTWIGKTPPAVMANFGRLRLGAQISNMALGCLVDTKQIVGTGDVKADSNVRRTLGRIVDGETLSTQRAIQLTRRMNPTNPWMLDRPLYVLGKTACASLPRCDKCCMSIRRLCTYANTGR